MYRTALLLLCLIAFLGFAGSARAESCEPGQNCQPSVGITYDGPDEFGHGTVNVSYSFPNTEFSSQRWLVVQINGANTYQTRPSTSSGVWSFDMPVTCWESGTYVLTAWAEACGRWESGYIASNQTSVTVDLKPTIALTYTGSDQYGHGVASIDFDFPLTDSSSQRQLFLQVDGVNVRQTRPADREGTWTFDFNTTCWTTGTHTLTAWAEACRWEEDSIARDDKVVETDRKPKMQISYDGPDENGWGEVTVGYDFPNTDSPSQRLITFQIDLVNQTQYRPSTNTGEWKFWLNTACWTTGSHTLTAWGESCGTWQDDSTGVANTAVSINHQPAATLKVDKTSSGAVAKVKYNFPQTNSYTQRVLELRWKETNALIASTQPGTVTGEWAVPVSCQYETEKYIYAIAKACGDATKKSNPGIIPKCDLSCSLGKCPECAGDPVHLTSGSMQYDDRDPIAGEVVSPLGRTYRSGSALSGAFGKSWVSIFDATIAAFGGSNGRETAILRLDDGSDLIFEQESGTYRQTYPAGDENAGFLTYDAGQSTFTYRRGGSKLRRTFRGSDGKLVRVGLAGSDSVDITYDGNGYPATVSDAEDAWSWTVDVDSVGRVESIAVDGHSDLTWTYTYTGLNLTTVTAPGDAPWRSYTYGSSGLEEARDPLGNLLESHQYDVDGQAYTSHGPSAEITDIQYWLSGRVAGEYRTLVERADGTSTDYYSRYIAGKMRTVEVDGSCNCGTEDTVYGHDDDGFVIREQNARGYITVRTYTNGLLASTGTAYRPATCDPESDTNRCRLTPDDLLTATLQATPSTTTTTMAYADANWPDLATSVTTDSLLTGENRVETYSYDAVTGEILTHMISGFDPISEDALERTTMRELYDGIDDAAFDPCTGASDCQFSSGWLSLPQPAGKLRVVDGPATGADVTTYVYYPEDSAVPAAWRGKLAAVKNAEGHISRVDDYDAFGNGKRIVDVNGVVTATTHDKLGRMLTSTLKGVPGCNTTLDPLCATDITRTQLYEPISGPLAIAVGPAGEATSYTYDGRGRTLNIRRGQLTPPVPSTATAAITATTWKERISYEYDVDTGYKTKELYEAFESAAWSAKLWTMFDYDASGHVSRLTHADSTTITYTYQHGVLASQKDENHSSANTFYEYDEAGRLREVEQVLSSAPSGRIHTGYTYDRHGNLATVTDPNGNVTTYAYDDLGQMRQQVSPVSGTTSYTYDVAGNLTSQTDANGATTARTYDLLGRPLQAISTRSGSPTETVTWSYLRDRFEEMTDPSGSTAYTYDRRALLLSEEKTIGTDTFTTSYGYDDSGNRTSLEYPSGLQASYSFDYAGRPIALAADATTIVASAAYLPFGPPTAVVLGNGTTTTRQYDTRYRLGMNRLTGPSGTLLQHDYTYDAAGNILGIEDALDATFDRTYEYDDLNRLVVADTGTSLWEQGTYTYDKMGNLTASQLGTWKTLAMTYSGTSPKLSTVTQDNLPRSVTYDAAGNETFVGPSAFAYSARNHSISGGGNTYDYDGRGARTVTHFSGTSTSRVSLYTPELQLFAEFEPASGHDFLYFAGRSVAQIDHGTGTIDWYVTDHLGTPIAQTDATGTLVWHAEYDPYGEIYAFRTGASKYQPLRFPGQEAGTGDDRSYNIFRWYRSGWGRYTQADPIGLQGGLDLYRYAGANPLSNVDRTGLVAWNCNIGYVSYETPGAGVGGATMVAKCRSECVNKKRVNAAVMGNLGGASALSPIPAGASYSTNVTLNDDFAEPKEDALGGLFAIGSIGAGIGFGPLNWSATYYRLGAANGYSIGASPFMVSLGIDAYLGAGSVIDSNTECCK